MTDRLRLDTAHAGPAAVAVTAPTTGAAPRRMRPVGISRWLS